MIGRIVRCAECRADVEVIEAMGGATSDAEHRWIDPASFVCGGCLNAEVLPESGASAEALEAARRAETAHREASWREKSNRIERSARRRMERASTDG